MMITSENEFYVNAYADWSYKNQNPEWAWIEVFTYNKKTGEATKMSLSESGSNYRYGMCTKD